MNNAADYPLCTDVVNRLYCHLQRRGMVTKRTAHTGEGISEALFSDRPKPYQKLKDAAPEDNGGKTPLIGNNNNQKLTGGLNA